MSRRRGARGLGRSFPRAAVVGVAVLIVVLVVIDVTLVALAISRTAPESHGTPGPIPTFSGTPRASAPSAPTPTASATQDAETAGQTTSDRHLLSAVNSREAWRASGSTCGVGKPLLQHSTDAGATWRTVTVGADVRAVWGLRATTAGVTVTVAVGDGCSGVTRTSSDDGATWKSSTATTTAAITPDGVVLGGSTVGAPCPAPLDAFQGVRTSVVVCDGQMEWRTGNAAWVDLPLGGLRSITVNGNAYTLARIGTANCAGVQIETMSAIGVSSSSRTTPVGCNRVDTGGPVAIDQVGASVWMWSGDDVAVSADGGATW